MYLQNKTIKLEWLWNNFTRSSSVTFLMPVPVSADTNAKTTINTAGFNCLMAPGRNLSKSILELQTSASKHKFKIKISQIVLFWSTTHFTQKYQQPSSSSFWKLTTYFDNWKRLTSFYRLCADAHEAKSGVFVDKIEMSFSRNFAVCFCLSFTICSRWKLIRKK